MSHKFNIPKNYEQLNAEQQMIIRTGGTLVSRQLLYNVMQPNAQGSYDVDKSYQAPKSSPDRPLIKSKSWLGTKVFSNLSLSSSGVNINIDTALFSVSMAKKIITTDIQGRNGTVKEYIADGDYQISINGVISGEYGQFPRNDSMAKTNIGDFHNLLSLPYAIKVNSWYLTQFGIFELVITDFKFEQKEGEYSIIPFEITAISDTPFELNISPNA